MPAINGTLEESGNQDGSIFLATWTRIRKIYEFDYDAGSGAWAVGETLTFTSPTGTGRLISITDNGATGHMSILLLTGTIPANNTVIAGATTGAATVDGAVTAVAETTSGAPLPARLCAHLDRTIQVTGTLGVGGTLVWEGSNDGGVTYATLTDPQGNALSFTAAGLEQVTELSEYARPRLTVGDVDTDLNVYCLLRRPNDMRT